MIWRAMIAILLSLATMRILRTREIRTLSRGSKTFWISQALLLILLSRFNHNSRDRTSMILCPLKGCSSSNIRCFNLILHLKISLEVELECSTILMRSLRRSILELHLSHHLAGMFQRDLQSPFCMILARRLLLVVPHPRLVVALRKSMLHHPVHFWKSGTAP